MVIHISTVKTVKWHTVIPRREPARSRGNSEQQASHATSIVKTPRSATAAQATGRWIQA